MTDESRAALSQKEDNKLAHLSNASLRISHMLHAEMSAQEYNTSTTYLNQHNILDHFQFMAFISCSFFQDGIVVVRSMRSTCRKGKSAGRKGTLHAVEDMNFAVKLDAPATHLGNGLFFSHSSFSFVNLRKPSGTLDS
jgi:hypothetical protein